MASDKKIVATKGREEIAGKRYSEIRDIISINSDMKFKDTIGEIAGISPGSYYNYTSENSPKYGRVSLFTVKNLSEFFSLPIGIFDCSEEFSEKAKMKIADIVRSKYTIKNNSQIIDDELIKKLEYSSKMEDKLPKDIIQNALENYFTYPFINKNHTINYFYLIEKYKSNIINGFDKNANIRDKSSMEEYDKAFMYCIAYDDLIMEYIRDGEIINFKKGITFENGIEFEQPNELEYKARAVYPYFMEIVLSMYSNNRYEYDCDEYDCLKGLKDFYSLLEKEESLVISRSRCFGEDKYKIKNIEWYKQLLNINQEETLEIKARNYTIDDFINSSIFQEYQSKLKILLLMFFDKIKAEGLLINIQLKVNNTFTIYANENVGNRLAIVSVYDDSINIEIMYDYKGWHCKNIEEIEPFIESMIDKYKNPPKHKGMEFDKDKNCFIED